jgi:UDP-GlcNAc:undecaprenyl-phosphate GlcNAc-1-phosphate transferase
MIYIIYPILALLISLAITPVVMRLAGFWGAVDVPNQERKIHRGIVPLLGGVAIVISFFLVLFFARDHILVGSLSLRHWLGFFGGAVFLMIGGFLDDKYSLRPGQQIIFPLLAIASVILGGVEIVKITNPLGGYIYFSGLVSALLIALWLLGMMYTTKLLDGVDGLVSGVSFIGSLVIFLFTLTTKYYQPDIALAAAVLAGSILGFLFYNFHPAKIFLGEGGSLFLGYALGVLAIISGGKIAIALLIMGIPILDLLWTVVRRLFCGKNPFRFADKKHLHHRLLDSGLSQVQTVLVFYILSLLFGLSGLFLESRGKFLALGGLFLTMIVLVVGFSFLDRRKSKENKATKKPRLLVHVCCAPCSFYTLEKVFLEKYDLSLYYYNPNIDTLAEWERRLLEVKKMAEKMNVPLIVGPYVPDEWKKGVEGYEDSPERGERCLVCYRERLSVTAHFAREKKFDFFTTSLTTSPYKDSGVIMAIGLEEGKEAGIKFLEYDFKTDDGSKKSWEYAKSLGIYCQKYCGCEYAKKKN